MNIRSRWLGVGLGAAALIGTISLTYTPIIQAATPAHRSTGLVAEHATKSGHCAKRNVPKGLLDISDWEMPGSANYEQDTTVTIIVIGDATLSNLIAFDSHGKMYPEIATAIPTVKNGGIAKNGRTVTVHLRPYAKWSSGQEITSTDVRFGWDVSMNKATGPSCLGTCDIISRIDTPNKTTVVFHLKRPDGAFVDDDMLAFFPWPTAWPGAWNSNDVAQAANKLWNDTTFNFEGLNYPTDGPYQVSQFVTGDRITMVPDKYYDLLSCGASFKQVVISAYPSIPALIAAAASHETDVTENYTPAFLTSLNVHKSAYTIVSQPAYWPEYLTLNQDATYNGKPNPLHNVKVRQAIALAIDHLGMLESALGINRATARKYIGFTWLVNLPHFKQPFTDSKITGQWDPIIKKYVYNTGSTAAIADAKKLLAQAGYPGGGFSLDWITTSGNATRQAQESVFAANMTKIGISVSPSTAPGSKLFGTWQAGGVTQHGQFQVGDWASAETTPDPASWIVTFDSKYIDRDKTTHSLINANLAGIRDPTIDRYFTLANHAIDKTLRQKYMNIVQQHVSNNADIIILYYRPALSTTDGKVKPFSDAAVGSFPEWNMYAWRPAHA
ncbi:MAG: ABC transporter substrate-binding protein [Chloroflexota bacterium]|nr:ABC transporter substrate-binding protein [Chloroflexota bacterium]